MSFTAPVRTAALGSALAASFLLAGCAQPGGGEDTAGGGAQAQQAVQNVSPFWADPRSDAAKQVASWQKAGRDKDAKLLERISEQPQAVWPTGGEDPGPDVKQAVETAARNKAVPVLVAYNIPHRDCGQHSAGGAKDAKAYQKWIGAFADNIEDNKAIVILEPDAVAHLITGCTPKSEYKERTQLLSGAVERLKKKPNVKVYLDAGTSGWVTDYGKLAKPMFDSGVAQADGFALNVSNFQPTDEVQAYGKLVSRRLGKAHFVIDTSRNGNGPLPGNRKNPWCNPPGRALGEPPTTKTGDKLVDAYLWIKHPGDSDGECRGGPKAGEWWPDYALGLARAAAANDR
ncbi:glycoside hydrolase family 6 protein [Streptomyces sp. A7024]|uniref:Glucanase n=1 Tax=Streptomyces coryli TaxID=1128680 RepID=A0A6G4TZG5_9ACTN|nr:glycoside hydrolase family 6 protein [Streptomyces coryli]NGN64910.1 glycoside hydrolase family 6 protein [Streptomyces coryli]